MFIGAGSVPRPARLPTSIRRGGGVWSPPYALPATGEVVNIAGNSIRDIKPGGMSDGNWDNLMWASWSTGILVPGASALGLYVNGCGGVGHNNGRSMGGACFDYTTGLWDRRDPTNSFSGPAYGWAVIPQSGSNWVAADTSGDPYYEIPSSGNMPSASHLYRNQIPRGANLLFVCRGACTADGSAAASGAVHLATINASTITWSRYTDSTSGRESVDMSVVQDDGRNRAWIIPVGLNSFTTLEYFDHADNTFKTSTSFSFPPNNCSENGFTFLHAGRYLIKRGLASDLYLMDLESIGTGWQGPLTTSGTMPTSVVDLPARFPGTGNYYWHPKAGGLTLTKLTPPGDPVAGTWAFGTSTQTGTSVPASLTGNENYTAFHYNAEINCLCMPSHATNGFYAMRPTS